MENIQKAGKLGGSVEVSDEVLAKINAYALLPLEKEQVFTFKLAACDSNVDRDLEQFTPDCLRALAPMFLGKTVILDHDWEVKGQTARIYDTEVVDDEGVSRLIEHCYMLRTEKTQATIDAINAGIMREVSVGCAVGKMTCSICGTNYCECGHMRGESYNGMRCVVLLEEPMDAYETSFVAVPAQREAGVVKSKGAKLEKTDREKENAAKDLIAKQREKRLALRNKILKI